jgi:hypothetical protein
VAFALLLGPGLGVGASAVVFVFDLHHRLDVGLVEPERKAALDLLHVVFGFWVNGEVNVVGWRAGPRWGRRRWTDGLVPGPAWSCLAGTGRRS